MISEGVLLGAGMVVRLGMGWLQDGPCGEMRNALIVTFSVDFKLTNRQNSSISGNKDIDVTRIRRDTFMACDHHGFVASNRVTGVGVEYFIVCKLS